MPVKKTKKQAEPDVLQDSSSTIVETKDDPAEIDSVRNVTECYKRSGETTFAEKEERVYEFAFSSEFPVARNFGMEVLSHDEGALNLERLNNSAPLLFNHDPNKLIVVVERAYLDKK